MALYYIFADSLDLLVIWSYYKLDKKVSTRMQERVTANLLHNSAKNLDEAHLEAQRRDAAWRELDYQQIKLIESMMTLMVSHDNEQEDPISPTSAQNIEKEKSEQLSSMQDSILLQSEKDSCSSALFHQQYNTYVRDTMMD